MNERGFKITWQVRQQAKKANIRNPHQLAQQTQLTYSCVLELWNGKAQGVNIVTLVILKQHLNCNVEDLYKIKWKKNKSTMIQLF